MFLWTHGADLARPSALVEAFDPKPLRTVFAAGGLGRRCQLRGLANLGRQTAAPDGCDPNAMLAAHRGENNFIGKLADAMPNVGTNSSGITTRANGTFTSVTPLDVKLAEVQRARCFQTDRPYSVERSLHSVTEQPRQDDALSMPRYLGYNDAAARNVIEAAKPADRDLRLVEYFKVRKLMGETIHRFLGDPGLQLAAARIVAADHQNAIAMLRQRLSESRLRSEIQLFGAGRN